MEKSDAESSDEDIPCIVFKAYIFYVQNFSIIIIIMRKPLRNETASGTWLQD